MERTEYLWAGKDQHIMIPGWPYSFVVALETGRSSWTAPLDALRLAPGDDLAAVTAAQLREVVERLMAAGHWQCGDPDILIVADAGYDGPRLAWSLRDLSIQILARMRSDRVLRRAAPARVRGTNGRPPRHGGEFIFGDRDSWGEPDVDPETDTRLYGRATAWAWDRLHPRLTRRAAWADSAELPMIEGTVIRLEVGHLPSGAIPKPVWLWWSQVDATAIEVDRMWQAVLRRFDIEHTFRLLKQTLGRTCPKIRDPRAADRWTWLILAVYTQLRLARPLAADLRRPWEKPASPQRAAMGSAQVGSRGAPAGLGGLGHGGGEGRSLGAGKRDLRLDRPCSLPVRRRGLDLAQHTRLPLLGRIITARAHLPCHGPS
ncbi:transposase [Nonomuraea sp. NPDC052129]|uniref:transposase n=1 Tax=Nonomuraea sp. NPDC052129 TaxID=3154651 RepID=UPI003444ED24